VRIDCKVNGKPAVVVGYAPGQKMRPIAIVICDGELKGVKLKDLDLGDLPDQLGVGKLVKLPKREGEAYARTAPASTSTSADAGGYHAKAKRA
jgi:hypothetical protein